MFVLRKNQNDSFVFGAAIFWDGGIGNVVFPYKLLKTGVRYRIFGIIFIAFSQGI